MRLFEHERRIKKIFEDARIESPGICARMLVESAAGLERTDYILSSDTKLTSEQSYKLEELVRRRLENEPMAYILGKKAFYDHEFIVSESTLIPRPETELIVELSGHFLGDKKINFLDAGTGTGCIGISLLAKYPHWTGFLLDISKDALKIACKNSALIANAANIIEGDFFNLPFKDNTFQLVVCNPPYISPSEKSDIMPDVLQYEPHLALFSGSSGLLHLNAIIKEAFRCLYKGGILIVEHGLMQRNKVLNICRNSGYCFCEGYNDLSSLPRIVMSVK